MRFTLVASSLGALTLLCIFVFLLFRMSESEKSVERSTPPPSTERIVPLKTETSVDVTPDVSQQRAPKEKPLGTDINMEYPIPD